MRFARRSTLTLTLLSASCVGAGAFAHTLAAQTLPASASGLSLDLAGTSATATTLTAAARTIGVAPVSASDISSSNAAALPDSPSFVLAGDSSADDADDQSGSGGAGASNSQIAPKYASTILPGQSAQPLSGGDKFVLGLRNTVSPFNFLSILISASYSQGVNSAPHYIDKSYSKRIGAAAARNAIQTLASDGILSPIFHDDPRYYVLGRQHKLLNRAVYAATRVVVTRSDSGSGRVNAPLLLGYAVAAGANNAYYPERDRGGKATAISYATSLGGAALGMEVSEFLNDALVLVHLRHR